jgi:hypothetical protein
MASIAQALERIKEDPQAVISPSIIENVCVELGLEWRNTALTPPVTIALLAQQVLAGNVSNPELIRLAGLDLTAAAYCTAKGRLPLEAVQEISRRVCAAAERVADKRFEFLWKGHRTWHMDGSTFSMPDTLELQAHFGQPGNQKPGCGFPVAHLLCLFSAATGLIRDVSVAPLRTNDLTQTPQVHPNLRSGDIVIGDTAFGSYFHIALLQAQGVLGVFPNHQKRIVSFRSHRSHVQPGKKKDRKGQPTSRWIKRLGKDDQIVEYFKPLACPKWMSQEQYEVMPPTITVREIRRKVYKSGHRPLVIIIVTTLLDPALYPAEEIVELLKQRWNVEGNLRHLKTTMTMEILRCQTVAGVQKELWTFLLIYNLVRVIMLEASQRQAVALDRISFADALYWMRYARPGEAMPELIVNPDRPGRVEPRAIKRRPKEYDRLTRPRAEMRKALKRRG